MAEIQHYGIKGMKWGVRRDNPSATVDSAGNTTVSRNGRVTGVALSDKTKSSSKSSDDASRAAVLKKRAATKSTDSLSNKDLKDLVERMNLEQQYSRLTMPQGKGGNSPAKVIRDVLEQEGRTLVRNAVRENAPKLAGAALQAYLRRKQRGRGGSGFNFGDLAIGG